MDEDLCEVCRAGPATGMFDLDGVESALCASCSNFRNQDGSVFLPNEPM